MHRYDLLEKKYYKKKILEYGSLGVLVLSLIGGGYYYLNLDKKKAKKIDDIVEFNIDDVELNNSINMVSTFEKEDKVDEKIENEVFVKKEPIKEEILLPEVNVSKKELEKLIKPNNEVKFSFEMPKRYAPFAYELSFYLPKPSKKIVKKEPIKIEKKEIKEKKDVKIPQKKDFEIKEEVINAKTLLNNFNTSPTFENAMLLSQYYFSEGDLLKAKEWALKANSIDSSRYESWEMFSKILLKKGQKEKAKKVLKAYLDNYGYNENIENLLRSIE